MRKCVLVFSGLIGFLLSCTEDEPLSKDSAMTFADSIAGVWATESVTLDAVTRSEWDQFELIIQTATDSTGLFIANTSSSEEYSESMYKIWPDWSAWHLASSGHLFRSDSIELLINLEDGLLIRIDPWQFVEPQDCDSWEDTDCPITDLFGFWEFRFTRLGR